MSGGGGTPAYAYLWMLASLIVALPASGDPFPISSHKPSPSEAVSHKGKSTSWTNTAMVPSGSLELDRGCTRFGGRLC